MKPYSVSKWERFLMKNFIFQLYRFVILNLKIIKALRLTHHS
ncbi:MAG: hypothetical protein AWM53_01793 [Candidatus Dichloromethanomonas elyunquensis]|nr:MAG: hypothetical protein AWM53_01793 [Candidatus Dichloromethanomonas elyunquensis]